MNLKSRCLWLFSVFNENYPQTPICLWIGNYLILPGISIFGINTPLPNVSDLWKLWSYVFRKGVQMNIVAGHLDNAGFNAIAKSSLLEKNVQYLSGENTSPNERHSFNVVTFLIWDYFVLFLRFVFWIQM